MTASQRERSNRQRLRGVVVRDKAHKTITVEVVRRFRHPRYGKMVRRHPHLAAHDPADEARLGDTVEIVSCRPLSKTKRYRLLRIVERGPGAPLVGQPPARPEPQAPESTETEAGLAESLTPETDDSGSLFPGGTGSDEPAQQTQPDIAAETTVDTQPAEGDATEGTDSPTVT